ncbi:MAG TPA: ABC transporter substrate-binding protein [Ktedonobacteraceae bacterium]|nr:ABC transporter substrate-binding protein [Ktedonobacteraceae bacterium]
MFSRIFSGRAQQPASLTTRQFFSLMFVLCLVLTVLLAACGQSSAATATTGTTATPTPALDVYGKPIVFPATPPKRIISLSPSMSEILGALHLDNRVVAVDYYTTYPSDLTKLPRISSSEGVYNVEQIVALKPDLVLSDGGLTKPYDSQLTALGVHLVDLPGTTLTQVLQKILLVGRLTFTQATAQSVVNTLQQQIASIKATVAGTTAPTVMLEADDSTPGKPYVFGGGSFGDELIQDANGINVFHNDTSGGGYPQVTDEAVIAANPQFIILTESPAYGGNPALVYQRPHWSGIAALKLHQVYALNVNIMQHPSQRLVDGLRCLAQILHPKKFTGALPAYCTGTV